MSNNISLIIGAVLAVCASVSVSQAQTIINGSFEEGFNGWSVTGNVDVAPYNSSDGTNSARFNSGESTPNAVLTQTFQTVPGDQYTLSFDFGSWSEIGSSQQSLAVEVRGNAILLSTVATVVGTKSIMNMIPHRFSFTADATNSTLTFRDVSTQTYSVDGHLDSVRLSFHQLSIRLSQVELCWPSRTDQVYQVQYCSALTTNGWTDLGSPIPGNGPTTCTYDAIAPGMPQRFYQVILVP